MNAVLTAIDSLSEYTGRVFKWVTVLLVLALVYEVAARYVFNAPTIWAHQLSTMLGATISAMGWAYTHRYHGHVRVDVVYGRLAERKQALIDVVCGVAFFFPLVFLLAYQSWSQMMYSWSMGEVLTQTYWYPPAGPIRTVVFVGLVLFGLQGTAQFIRDARVLLKGAPVG